MLITLLWDTSGNRDLVKIVEAHPTDGRAISKTTKVLILAIKGGTMMECFIHPTIEYSRVSEIIKTQKEYIVNKVKELSLNEKAYDGKTLRKLIDHEKDSFTRKNAQNQMETFRINPEKIPGVEEGGWTW